MPINASVLAAQIVVIGAAEAEGEILGAGAAADATTARFRTMATVAAGVLVIGLIAVGAASVKMAADFQQGVNRLRTGGGDMQDTFASLSKGILQVSVDTGVMTGPLVKAMYLIVSSGQRGAEAFNTLSVAAKGAQIEQANVVDVANVVSGAMTNYGTKVFGAAQFMNGLIKAVSMGKVSLQDLSTAMGPIDPIAHSIGISFADVAAAMSTQTNAMIPAARAATGLRFMMLALENPTAKATTAMKDLGLNSIDVANEMKVSLPGALQMIVNAALKVGPEGSVPFNRAVGDMVGGIRSLSTFTALTGPNMASFLERIKAITSSMKSGSGDVNGWALAQSNFNIQMDKGKAAIAAAGIGLGLVLLPALTHLLGLLPGIVSYLSNFQAHAGVLVPILAGVGAILVGLLVPAIWAFASGVIAATWPVLLIGAAIAGLVAIFMHFYQTSAPFKAFIDGLAAGFKQVAGFVLANFIPAMIAVGTWLKSNVLPILQQIGAFLLSTFAPVWQQLVSIWNSSILPSLKQLWAALTPLLPLLKLLGEVIGVILVVALGLLVGILSGVIKALAGFLTGLATVIGGVIQVFTGIVQVISGIVRFIYDLLTGNFGALKGDLATIWAGIVNIFGGAWRIIEGIFQAAWGVISGLVSGFVQGIIGFFEHLYTMLVGHSIIPDMINGIVQWFAQLPGRVGAFVLSLISNLLSLFASLAVNAIAKAGQLVNGVVNWIAQLPGRVGAFIASMASVMLGDLANLANQAIAAGARIVQNIASGIFNNIGSFLGNAMGAVGNFISSHLPFSPAKVGPLVNLQKQGANIMAELSKGMIGAIPQLRATMNLALSPISTPGLSVPSSLATRIGTANGQAINVYVQSPDMIMDGVRMSRQLLPHFHSAIIYSTGKTGR